MNFVNALGVRAKLNLMVGMFIVALVVLSGFVDFRLKDLQQKYELTSRVLKIQNILGNAYAEGLQCGQALRNCYIDPQDEKAFKNLKKAIGDVNKGIEELKKPEYTAVSKGLEKFNIEPLEKAFVDDLNALVAKIESGENVTTDEIKHNTGKAWRPFKDALNQWKEANAKKSSGLQEEYQQTISSTFTFVIIMSIVIIILSIGVSLMISSSLISSVAKLKVGLMSFFDFLGRKSSHAEMIDIKSNDEFGVMSTIINQNIGSVEDNIKKDDEFIKDVNRFGKELGTGNFLAKIDRSSDNPNLIQLKATLTKLQYDLEHEIARDLNILKDVLNKFKNQDFTPRFPNAYGKVAVSINELGDVVSAMLKQSMEAGITMDNSSTQLLGNVDNLSRSANEAASALEETAAALEEITSTITNTTHSLSQVASNASDLRRAATNGMNLATNTTSAMDEISNQVNSINEAITVIDQIAFQTNILSLNAAVEAATAGEAGKGFAVVAQEVRNLATRSAEAAKEIKNLVENANLKAHEGKNISDSMIQGYKDLAANIEKTTEIIQDITQASNEQQSGISQINNAITDLDRQTQLNANVASETREIAIQTSKIAKSILEDAIKKEFVGKSDVNVASKETPKVKTESVAPVSHKINLHHKPVSTATKPAASVAKSTPAPKPMHAASVTAPVSSKKNDDEWESF